MTGTMSQEGPPCFLLTNFHVTGDQFYLGSFTRNSPGVPKDWFLQDMKGWYNNWCVISFQTFNILMETL